MYTSTLTLLRQSSFNSHAFFLIIENYYKLLFLFLLTPREATTGRAKWGLGRNLHRTWLSLGWKGKCDLSTAINISVSFYQIYAIDLSKLIWTGCFSGRFNWRDLDHYFSFKITPKKEDGKWLKTWNIIIQLEIRESQDSSQSRGFKWPEIYIWKNKQTNKHTKEVKQIKKQIKKQK